MRRRDDDSREERRERRERRVRRSEDTDSREERRERGEEDSLSQDDGGYAGAGWGSKAQSQAVNAGGDRFNLSDHAEVLDLSKKGKYLIRIIGQPVYSVMYWIDIHTKAGGVKPIPVWSCAANILTGEIVGADPIAALQERFGDKVRPRTELYSNAIVRQQEEDEPRNLREPELEEDEPRSPIRGVPPQRIKDINSKSWTPVKAVRLTPSVVKEILAMSEVNVHEGEVKYANDPEHGFDVMIISNPDAKVPGDKYKVVKSNGISPLTRKEKGFLVQNIWAIEGQKPSYADAKKNAERLVSQITGDFKSRKKDDYDDGEEGSGDYRDTKARYLNDPEGDEDDRGSRKRRRDDREDDDRREERRRRRDSEDDRGSRKRRRLSV